MTKHFKETANWIKKTFLKKNSYLLELGSNDGTFLQNFNKKKPLDLNLQKVFMMYQKKEVFKV